MILKSLGFLLSQTSLASLHELLVSIWVVQSAGFFVVVVVN